MDDVYENPLITRYASHEMAACFSETEKIRLWRRLWVALAEAQMELGLSVSSEQVEELKAHQDDINMDVARAFERELRHDVMAHIRAYGQQCPSAQPILHLGATSCYVGDNADILIMDQALEILHKKLVNVLAKLADFALRYRELPTLGFTHLQPAQLTTVGKRASLWLQDFWMDYTQLQALRAGLRLRGVKGTTGTQASYMTLFEGDEAKIDELERRVAHKMGMPRVFPVTGQTYPRKLDYQLLCLLSCVAQSASKMANDIRLLQSLKEMEEPFERQQVGSSAMAYKRNPMRTERICALARFVESLPVNASMTASTQWMERTLDDSANKRLVIPQAFLAVDAVLSITLNVTANLVVYERVIRRHIEQELPFMATETVLMEAVKAGADRQVVHERIRIHAMEAGRRVKEQGLDNDLLERLSADPVISLPRQRVDALLDPGAFTGRAASQVTAFIAREIQPILEENRDLLGLDGEVRV